MPNYPRKVNAIITFDPNRPETPLCPKTSAKSECYYIPWSELAGNAPILSCFLSGHCKNSMWQLDWHIAVNILPTTHPKPQPCLQPGSFLVLCFWLTAFCPCELWLTSLAYKTAKTSPCMPSFPIHKLPIEVRLKVYPRVHCIRMRQAPSTKLLAILAHNHDLFDETKEACRKLRCTLKGSFTAFAVTYTVVVSCFCCCWQFWHAVYSSPASTFARLN